jgi:acyl-[acyl-carrier-protein]-phospholipid O-acyltransferase/long-chain-fatty-acid--[acyl-carrier-protein] ligase
MTGSYADTLKIRGFKPFLATQFLGAFIDNVFKMIVTFYVIRTVDPDTGTSIAAGVFILPFLLFSGYAGRLADAYSKRSVLIWTTSMGIPAMVLAIPALLANRGDILLIGMFIVAAQAAFFSPAKYGIVPEMMPATELSRANGLLEMSSYIAIVAGTWLGGEMFDLWHDEPWWLAVVLVALAILATGTSFGITGTPPARATGARSWNPWSEIARGVRRAWPDRTLRMTMVGIGFVWFLGAFMQMVLVPFGLQSLGVTEGGSARLYTFIAIGIALGALTAGRLSGDKVEPGLVPIGSIGMGVFILVLSTSAPSFMRAGIALAFFGFFLGMFGVPLNALLQQRADDHEKGRLMATSNMVNTLGGLSSAAMVFTLTEWFHASSAFLFVLAGSLTLVATVIVLTLVPDFFMRFLLWLLTHTIYRIKIVGTPNVPVRGPALIIANHVSHIDGALVGACLQRFVRFLVWGPYFKLFGIGWLLRRLHAIPITAGNKQEVADAIERARAELLAGHVVCIFAEGAISRTGNLLPFRRGFERILQGVNVPVIPVYLDRVWGSIFSFKKGRFFWKLPERIPYNVTVAFGKPLPSSTTANEARMAVMELAGEAMAYRRDPRELLHTAFIRTAKRHWGRLAMADSTGQKLSYGRGLVGSLLLAERIRRRTPGQDVVGLLLPSSVGGALANIAVLAAGRIPVNLNFTSGPEAMAEAIEEARISTIFTSKRFLEKAGIAALPSMVYLEDLRAEISGLDKVRALLAARLTPASLLARRYRGDRTAASLATIIFSSGSTGVPKGVMITHANILANVDSLAQIFPMGKSDCFIGVLPFFHSFGLTGTLWFPLLQGCAVAYHPNPMDAKTIGELAETYKGSMLISTPTFCASYVRRCTKEQFAHLRYAIVGAEKLREPIATAFEQQFGVALLEGYGCTEMSPVVSVNRPNVEHHREKQIGTKFGSVGHPIPGVSAKIVDQETGEGPLIGREGLLLVKGPNMMVGYLNHPERTAEAMRDGWYATGDIAMIDEDGFIFITDRLSRFSKIAGEMVPHVRIEEAINVILGEACCAVTAVADASRGERLVAFHTKSDVAAEALWDQLSATELPKLWLPRRDSLFYIEAIPTLGSGKVDLRKLRQLAAERAERGISQPPPATRQTQ